MCASGIEACAIIAAKIKAGIIDVGLAGGVESMTMGDMNSMVNPEQLSEEFFEDARARNTILSMGVTADVSFKDSY
jgi:acetyl-CoA acyltransferase 1